jgi:hypothetical protein
MKELPKKNFGNEKPGRLFFLNPCPKFLCHRLLWRANQTSERSRGRAERKTPFNDTVAGQGAMQKVALLKGTMMHHEVL